MGHARFVTFSCYQRLPLLNDPKTRDAFVEQIEFQRGKHQIRIAAWVIMPEHVHIILCPPDGQIGSSLRSIKQGFARSMLARWKTNQSSIIQSLIDPRGDAHFWQRGGGYDRNINDLDDLNEKIEYIHSNPIRRGLVKQPTQWVWSSACDYAGGKGPIMLWRP